MDVDISTEQQMLVQWCMSTQSFSEHRLKEAIERIFSEEDSPTVQAKVDGINHSLSEFSLELKSKMDQESGGRIWALVNIKADEISKIATIYSPTELSVLRTLIEGVFTQPDGNYAMGMHDAIRKVTGVSQMTQVGAQSLIMAFCKNKWLGTVDDGWLVLGTRTLIELRGYLGECFEGFVRECALCNEIATCGSACSCGAFVHPYCARRITESSGMFACPACNQKSSNPVKFGPGRQGIPHDSETATEPASISADVSEKHSDDDDALV